MLKKRERRLARIEASNTCSGKALKNPRQTLILIVVAIIAGIALLQTISGTGFKLPVAAPQNISMTDFLEKVRNKEVRKVDWQLDELTITTNDNKAYKARAFVKDSPSAKTYIDAMNEAKVPLYFLEPPIGVGVLQLLSFLAVPALLAVFFYIFFYRPAQMGGNQAMSFGKSKARRVGEAGTKVTFDDVAGIEEAKQELYEIVDFLKNTKKYTSLGAKIPKGILLSGPPGVGKTHLARAIAGEAGVPFFHISGSDFVEMFVGVGAARVRDLFETAKAHRPSLIFVDEIDAVGRQRGAGLGGGHDEREQTLNQLLVEMDGFDPNSGVILIAATNRPDVLDPALLRPGRFDRQIVVDAPDQNGRLEILKIHSKGKPLDLDVDLDTIAKRTSGFTGAALANTLNEGALLAARRGHTKISRSDLEEALDRVIAGPQRKSRIMDSEEREIIAYHEAGHALIGEILVHSDPVHKVTILPRGMSLGSTWQLPEADKFLVSREELEDDVAVLLGGRVAEEIAYGRVWTGASSDLQRVTAIARAMVTKYGMSERLGTLAIGSRQENPFLGRDFHEQRDYSEDVAKMIDEEVRAIVDRAHLRAREILTERRVQLDAIVHQLLERETLDRTQFLMVLEGKELPPVVVEEHDKPVGPEAKREVEKSNKSTIVPPRFEPGPA